MHMARCGGFLAGKIESRLTPLPEPNATKKTACSMFGACPSRRRLQKRRVGETLTICNPCGPLTIMTGRRSQPTMCSYRTRLAAFGQRPGFPNSHLSDPGDMFLHTHRARQGRQHDMDQDAALRSEDPFRRRWDLPPGCVSRVYDSEQDNPGPPGAPHRPRRRCSHRSAASRN